MNLYLLFKNDNIFFINYKMSQAINKFNIVKNILNKSIFDENIIYTILNYYWQILNKHKILLNWININDLQWNY